MNKVIQYRVSLFQLLTLAQSLGVSRELSLAVTALQAARMQLGTVAELLGSPTPYPQADNPASKVVHPVADVGESVSVVLPEDPIQAVKVARVAVQSLLNDMTAWRREQWARPYGTIEEALYDRALCDVILAKQWLGEQLAVLAGHPVVRPAQPLLSKAEESAEGVNKPDRRTKRAARSAAQTDVTKVDADAQASAVEPAA